jgi:hypothetical protein
MTPQVFASEYQTACPRCPGSYGFREGGRGEATTLKDVDGSCQALSGWRGMLQRVSSYNTPYNNTGPGNSSTVPCQPKDEGGCDQEAELSW